MIIMEIMYISGGHSFLALLYSTSFTQQIILEGSCMFCQRYKALYPGAISSWSVPSKSFEYEINKHPSQPLKLMDSCEFQGFYTAIF